MDRTAIFVDAGYLFASGAKLIANESLHRGDLNLNHDAIIDLLTKLAAELTGLPLLRIYWYDGTATGPTPQQLALAYQPNVKLRLGFMNQQGQKGVDSLVVADLINLARNRAMVDALLLTGDEDIRVGVQQAQELGVRVHLIGIEPTRDNQSGLLVQEADGVRELTVAQVRSFLTRRRSPSAADSARHTAEPAAESGPTTLVEVARQIAGELNAEEMEAVLKHSPGGSVSPEIDSRLLRSGSAAMGSAQLTPEQKRSVRTAFLAFCRSAVKKTLDP
jgi:uncharacterized LabA/DUF88 family protein